MPIEPSCGVSRITTRLSLLCQAKAGLSNHRKFGNSTTNTQRSRETTIRKRIPAINSHLARHRVQGRKERALQTMKLENRVILMIQVSVGELQASGSPRTSRAKDRPRKRATQRTASSSRASVADRWNPGWNGINLRTRRPTQGKHFQRRWETMSYLDNIIRRRFIPTYPPRT